MKLKRIILGLAVSALLYYIMAFKQKEAIILPKNQNKKPSTAIDLLPRSTTNVIIKHNYFSLSYNENYEQAEWVAYELKPSELQNTKFKRPFFVQDPQVASASADRYNYKKSGYDKGHLCPAADMKISTEAYHDTFFTSNVSPQKHVFNAGVWERLEEKTRYWAMQYGQIFVVTAGVLNENLQTIGPEKVAVPKLFYKILFYNAGEKSKMIAFLVPHEKSDAPLYSFVSSVDAIEDLTGIDFFPKLNDKLENKLEKISDYKNWSYY